MKLPFSFPCLAVGGALGTAALVAFAIWKIIEHKRRKAGTFRKNVRTNPLLLPKTDRPASESGCRPWPSPPQQGEGLSDEWLSFVTERLEESRPHDSLDETKWAIGVVDFLDELKEAGLTATEQERVASRALADQLLALLTEKGFTLLDSDEWNPDKQRAVAVVRKPDATGTKILGKGSTGLSRNGRIIRKQEVKIEMKGN